MAEIENRGPEVFKVAITLLVASVITCLLRIYTRLGIVKAFGYDDWFMCAATVSIFTPPVSNAVNVVKTVSDFNAPNRFSSSCL